MSSTARSGDGGQKCANLAHSPKGRKKSVFEPGLLEEVQARLESGKRVRRTLPREGRLHVDRELPFLCVYRRPRSPDPGTSELVTSEASYLVAPGEGYSESVRSLVTTVVEAQIQRYGAFLVVEVWAKQDASAEADPRAIGVQPVFEVDYDPHGPIDPTVEVLTRHLRRIKVLKQSVSVDVVESEAPAPPGMRPLIARKDRRPGLHFLGIAVPPVYRDESRDQSTPFPLVLSTLRRRLGLALRRAFYDFTKRLTTYRPPHYHELGPRAMVKSVWKVDAELAEVSRQFDYLLNVTPVNTTEAWREFKRTKFQRSPEFHYLPLPFDPPVLKRQLFKTPIERVEDPALENLFLKKQAEMDRKITMLSDRNTRQFLFGSCQLFGPIGESLQNLAARVLSDVDRGRGKRRHAPQVDAREFARRARLEMDRYRKTDPIFDSKAVVTGKVAGVMVSRGQLLIGHEVTMAETRVDPLIQHEVGTHLVTYFNGRAQPLRQLASGLAGYEELQEGLAVLGEYLVGGLSAARLRQLAARVIAVGGVMSGAEFVDTFRSLTRDHGFEDRSAFNIAMRVHRGGGFTKDVIYLRGFEDVVRLVRGGTDLEELFIGKLATEHIGIIRELRIRGVLVPQPLRPHFLDDSAAQARLEALREETREVSEFLPGLASMGHP